MQAMSGAAKETVQETLAKPCYLWKPLRICGVYWVPAFAGTTNVGFLHSLESRKPTRRHSCEGDCATNADSPTIETFESGTGKKGSY